MKAPRIVRICNLCGSGILPAFDDGRENGEISVRHDFHTWAVPSLNAYTPICNGIIIATEIEEENDDVSR